MLDRLRGREEARVQSRRAFELLHYLLALLDYSHDRVAGLATWVLLNLLKHFLEARDMFFGLGLVLFKCRFELCGLGSFGHFWQGAQDLFFCKINVFQRFMK